MSEHEIRSHRAPANRRGRFAFLYITIGLTVGLLVGGAAAFAIAPGDTIGCQPGEVIVLRPGNTWACIPDPSGSPAPSPSATQTPSPSPSTTPSPSPSVTPTATTPPASTPPATTPPPSPSPTVTGPPALLTNCLDDLRKRLTDANLAGMSYPTADGDEYRFRSNEAAAALAVRVVGEFLEDEAEYIETEHDGDEGDNHRPIVLYLRWLADEITPKADVVGDAFNRRAD